MIERALISVSDKSGLEGFARQLSQLGGYLAVLPIDVERLLEPDQLGVGIAVDRSHLGHALLPHTELGRATFVAGGSALEHPRSFLRPVRARLSTHVEPHGAVVLLF